MTTGTQNTAASGLKAFEDRIKAQVEEGKTKLDQFEAKAKEKRTETETAAVAKLQTSKQDIDRKLQDLKTTHETHVARAKSDIEADVAKFKTAVADLGARIKGNQK
jgi:hypothetical protein